MHLTKIEAVEENNDEIKFLQNKEENDINF